MVDYHPNGHTGFDQRGGGGNRKRDPRDTQAPRGGPQGRKGNLEAISQKTHPGMLGILAF